MRLMHGPRGEDDGWAEEETVDMGKCEELKESWQSLLREKGITVFASIFDAKK